MNSVNLIGNIGKEIELKQTQNGKSVCSFSLAVKGYGDRMDWITIVAWEKTAELLANNVHKGQKIGITGSIQTRKYEDKNGNKRTAFEVVANSITFCESKSSAPKAEASQGSFDDYQDLESDESLPF